jgi:hypothetical protein
MICKRIYIFLFFLILMQCSFFHKGGREGTLEGRIYITGNEPFTRLALENTEGDVFLLQCEKELEEELWQLQGKSVLIYYINVDSTAAGTFIKVKEFKTMNKEYK